MTTNKPIYRGKKILRYRLYRYELWGNRRDGFEVNNIFATSHEFDITVRGEVKNAGTMDEFVSFWPTDLQINRALGDRGLKYDGEADDTLYAEDKYGDPVKEIRFIGTVTKHANGDETVIHSFPETKYTHFATIDEHLAFCEKRLAEMNRLEVEFPYDAWKAAVNNDETEQSYTRWLMRKAEGNLDNA